MIYVDELRRPTLPAPTYAAYLPTTSPPIVRRLRTTYVYLHRRSVYQSTYATRRRRLDPFAVRLQIDAASLIYPRIDLSPTCLSPPLPTPHPPPPTTDPCQAAGVSIIHSFNHVPDPLRRRRSTLRRLRSPVRRSSPLRRRDQRGTRPDAAAAAIDSIDPIDRSVRASSSASVRLRRRLDRLSRFRPVDRRVRRL